MGSSRTNKQRRTPVFGVSSTPFRKQTTPPLSKSPLSSFPQTAFCALCWFWALPYFLPGLTLPLSSTKGEMEESCSLRRSTCGLGSRRSLVPPTLPCSWSPWIGHDRQGTSEASQAANWSDCLTRCPIRHRCFVVPHVFARREPTDLRAIELTTRCPRPIYPWYLEGESILCMCQEAVNAR
jgi:hypothetical protein